MGRGPFGPLALGLLVVAAVLAPLAAAGLAQHNVEVTECWLDVEGILCGKVTLRFHSLCNLGPFDNGAGWIIPARLGECHTTSEWYWLAQSFVGLPGEGGGTFGHVITWGVPTGQLGEIAYDDEFEHCAWQSSLVSTDLGCSANTLSNDATGLVPLAAGECLTVTMDLAVTMEAYAPVEGSPIAVAPGATRSFTDSVCA